MYEITNQTELDKVFSDHFSEIICLDFHAQWCRPCKAIAPWLKEFCEKNGIILVKIDVDEADKVSEMYKVKCMPTFVFQLAGKSLQKIEGANKTALMKFAEHYCQF